MLLAIVHLKRISRYEDAAKWAERGAAHARLALGDDSSAFLKFSSLAEVFCRSSLFHALHRGHLRRHACHTFCLPGGHYELWNDAQAQRSSGAEEPNAVGCLSDGPAEEWDEVVKGATHASLPFGYSARAIRRQDLASGTGPCALVRSKSRARI